MSDEHTPYNANIIADYLLWFFHEHGDLLTNLKLQKLLYYAQAWYLGLHGKPLIYQDFEAWVHGPVIPEIYKRFKKYTYNAISEEVSKPNINSQVEEFLLELINTYGRYAAFELEYMTHNDLPWIMARGNLPIDEPCYNIISVDEMRIYYKKEAEDNGRTTTQ